MKNQADYTQYECPYAHLKKECCHELKGPEGYENTYGVWCECGFRGPVFYLDPEELRLKKKVANVELTGAAPLCGEASSDRREPSVVYTFPAATGNEGKYWWITNATSTDTAVRLVCDGAESIGGCDHEAP